MKSCLVLFKNPKELIDFKTVNSVLDTLNGANFSVDDIFTFSNTENNLICEEINKIRQSYDTVYVLNCNQESKLDGDFDQKAVYYLDGNYKEKLIREVIPSLNQRYSVKYGKVVFKVFGLTEQEIAEKLNKIKDGLRVRFNVVGQNLDYKIEIIYDDKSTKMDYDFAQKELILNFKDNIYAEKDVTLEQLLVELLKLRKCVLGVAESFTGGNISAKITSVSGSSSVFYEGIVSYNERAKINRLGVNEESIEKYKPVSGQVAGEMAYGLIKDKNVDIAVSTTGIAGPNSDDSGFPVGRCYIGVAYGGEVSVYHYEFDGNREEITEKGTKTAMFLAVKKIKNI
ncbi:MAG: CinA family protein [Clostridiales bacterium]|nr:CinA family protein [Clostridiales bacterium]